MRSPRISTILALRWTGSVTMPAWLPVKLLANGPRSRMAMHKRAAEMRSPDVRSMSISLGCGLSDTARASSMRRSVLSPMADTTTHTRSPLPAVRTTRRATLRIFSGSATEVPPNFCTTRDISTSLRPVDSHPTASAIIVSADGERILLHRHRWSGRWIQPGGHIDAGEAPWDAALREAAEETGIEGLAHPAGGPARVGGSRHRSPVKPNEEPHLHDDSVWLLMAPAGAEPSPPPGESPACQFLSWAEGLARAADDALREALMEARRRISLSPQDRAEEARGEE